MGRDEGESLLDGSLKARDEGHHGEAGVGISVMKPRGSY